MGFLKPLAQMGASFIPGVGPIASAAIGAIGSSGSQGKQKYQGEQTQNEKFNSTSEIDQFDEAVEAEDFSNFRSSLLPLMQQQLKKAQQPVYGDAQKASYLSNLNDLADSSMKSLRSSLGASGAGDSGALMEGASGIQRDRFGQAAGFFSQLPFMEQQAQAERMNPLLQMATGFAGRAPISTRRTGTTTQDGTRESKGTNQGQQEQFGPSWLKNFTAGVGGAGAYGGASGRMPSLWDSINRGNASQNVPGGPG